MSARFPPSVLRQHRLHCNHIAAARDRITAAIDDHRGFNKIHGRDATLGSALDCACANFRLRFVAKNGHQRLGVVAGCKIRPCIFFVKSRSSRLEKRDRRVIDDDAPTPCYMGFIDEAGDPDWTWFARFLGRQSEWLLMLMLGQTG